MSKLYQRPNSASDSKRFPILTLIRLHLLSFIYDVSSSTQLRMQRCDGGCKTLPVFLLMFVEELVPRAASIALSFLLLILCSTNLHWKERIFHKWNISVNSTHQYFLLCLLSNCKTKHTLGLQSPATKIGEQKKIKKKKKNVNFKWSSYTQCYLFAKLYIWVLYKRGTSVLLGSA